jgi:CRP-like cAMP-binding protein
MKWVSSIKFFENLPLRIVKDTCDKLARVNFKPGEAIMNKGDPGDCMFIIFMGKAQILLEPGNVVGTVSSRDVIGEHALDTMKPRTATVMPVEPITAFKLTKLDYDSILLNIKKLEKYKSSKLLMTIPFFRNWSYLKVQHISNYLFKKTYKAGHIIYDKGDESDTFYILKSGQVDIQAYIELQHINRWPTGSKQWKILEINRKYIVNIVSLKRGSYFGETALIEQMPRAYRAVCATDTVCLTINKDEFFDIFSVKDMESLQVNTYIHVPSEKVLQKKLISELSQKSSNVIKI